MDAKPMTEKVLRVIREVKTYRDKKPTTLNQRMLIDQGVASVSLIRRIVQSSSHRIQRGIDQLLESGEIKKIEINGLEGYYLSDGRTPQFMTLKRFRDYLVSEVDKNEPDKPFYDEDLER